MDFSALTTATVDFVKTHQAWAPVIVAVLAFGESLAILSLLIPATAMLLAIGALVGVTQIELWPLIVGGTIGASLGDWVSYEVARYFGDRIKGTWPLNRQPGLVGRAEVLIQRYGAGAIFIGRFFGPLRALVPLVAGLFEMPRTPFQLANVASAVVWAAMLLIVGDVAGDLAARLFAWFTEG